MAYWITGEAEQWIEAAEAERGRSRDAVWASDVLRDDLMRWSRWWLGLGVFVAAFVAAGLGGTLAVALIVAPPGSTGQVVASVGLVAVSIAILVVTGVVLWRLHRSGRLLARSLRWWLRVRAEVIPNQGLVGWMAPRTVLFRPAVFVRVLTATVAGLLGVFGFGLLYYSVTQNAALVIASVLWGALGIGCCIGQLGAVMRLVIGLADADPLWNAIR